MRDINVLKIVSVILFLYSIVTDFNLTFSIILSFAISLSLVSMLDSGIDVSDITSIMNDDMKMERISVIFAVFASTFIFLSVYFNILFSKIA